MHDGVVQQKYKVERLDGKDRPGQPKENARYFVLDIANDKYAIEALKFYAFICHEEMPILSESLWMMLRETAKEKNG